MYRKYFYMMSSFFGEIGFENSAKYKNMEQRLTNPNKALKLSSIEIPWILVSQKKFILQSFPLLPPLERSGKQITSRDIQQ